MARLFPLRSETPTTDGTPRVVDLDGEDADDVFGALSSTTARQIYATLDAEPGTPSDVADAIDSSIQNVRYHLEKLEDAGLVEVVDTWYSSRGNEMNVYATANGPLIVASDESRATQLKQAVSRYIGGIGALAIGSFALQAIAMRYGGVNDATGAGSGDSTGAGGDESYTEQSESDSELDSSSTDSTGGEDGDAISIASEQNNTTAAGDEASGGGGEPDGLLDGAIDGFVSTIEAFASLDSPGLLFFLGGLVVLTALVAWWYVENYQRPQQLGRP
ncbi:putative transcriptional regulator [Halovivax ruber XH-70]|uniref:Putative transcriptional regulator n=1 Tax=Halovivax ruber (strain DSM 18193 / JCM 13892 / XH-70) TaxID=797302 RepID=L0IFN1_HALRX|nr:helix-turn-helix domain-containing protein [Halovivax ruber]AGB16777.1 putative transcriptional regulator [Halovivax ruber XH-70]